MNTNTAIMVPTPQATPTNAPAKFSEALKPIIEIPNPWLWAIWIGSILVVALIAYLVWRYWKKQAALRPSAPLIPAHKRAYMALESALSLLSDPKAFSIAVSGAIRGYLEERFSFHAPDRTTEEFLYELQSTNLLTPDQKVSLGEFLANCDLIKFAKYEPTEVELRAMHAAAVRLVFETEPHPVTTDVQSSTPATGVSKTS